MSAKSVPMDKLIVDVETKILRMGDRLNKYIQKNGNSKELKKKAREKLTKKRGL